MSTNRIAHMKDQPGLCCECGNEEALAENGRYETFISSWSTKGGHGIALAACKACNSSMDEVLEVLPQRDS